MMESVPEIRNMLHSDRLLQIVYVVPFVFLVPVVFQYFIILISYTPILPVIIWWTPSIFPHFSEDLQNAVVISCGAWQCISSNKRSYYNEVNEGVTAFMFYGTDLLVNDLPLATRIDPRVLWALLHEESPMNNYLLSQDQMINLFNFTSTFSRHSHHPLTTLFVPSIRYLTDRKPVPLYRKNRLRRSVFSPVLYVQSNCDVSSDRDAYVKELSKFIPIDSYGKCFHNTDLPFGRLQGSDKYGTEEFLDFIADYKFHLAFENAICDDYITEKLFRAFHVGSVPVYLGSSTVADWAPAPGTIIEVKNFETPERLAQFILDIDADDVRYEEYLRFKTSDGIQNDNLVNVLASRPWAIRPEMENENEKPDFVSSYECFVCERLHEIQDRIVTGVSIPSMIANRSHLGCPEPKPAINLTSNIENWINQYRRTSEIAEALQQMVHKKDYDLTKINLYVNKSEL